VSSYQDVNRLVWDERAAAHAASPDYAVASFRDDPQHLSDVVRFDLPLLGDVSGLRGVHLQCHIGTDTISLARLGASMTGLDFSGASVAQARELAAAAGDDVAFVESDVYAAREVLDGEFDLVFTGIGTFVEHDSVPWEAFPGHMDAVGGGEFRLSVRPERLPHSYTLVAAKA